VAFAPLEEPLELLGGGAVGDAEAAVPAAVVGPFCPGATGRVR
jgi:hypothetical protein